MAKHPSSRSTPRRPSSRPTRPSARKPQGKSSKRFSRYVMRFILALVGAAVLFFLAFFAVIQFTPFDASKLAQSNQQTVVYAADGSVYATLSPSTGSNLPFQDIPKDLQNALVATEDHNFWNSGSVDVRGMFRAAFVDLWSQRLAQGGSTIQEQLAKIVYLNDKKTFGRKIQQIALGVQINRHFTKQEILTMYFNRVFLGEGCTGVQAAAYRYFGVDLEHNPGSLTLDEAAVLAGLPQAPTAYDPLLHPQAALTRRNQVLMNMVKYGYISDQTAEAAMKQPLGAKDHGLPGDDGWTKHPLFANFLVDYLTKEGVLTQDQLAQGGLKIYTTIDPKVQSALETVFSDPGYANDFPASINGTPAQAGAVFMDPKTGAVLGGVGSRKVGYTRLGFDRAMDITRSPGSSIKPIMEYAPAIESGQFGPNTVLNNTPHDFGGGYTPHNDDWNAPGQCTLSYALMTSQNVASVSLLQKIGLDNGVSFAENDGIHVDPSKKTLGVAIGGGLTVNPLQMAQAYEAFDNQGVQMQEHLINRVVNQAGEVIYQSQTSSKRIMSAQTASVMTGLMQNVVQAGTGQAAAVPGWGTAGKTGTVEFPYGNHPGWIDNVWFDGYTPNMVGSVYVGFDNTNNTYHLFWSQAPNHYPATIFSDVMKLAEAGRTPQQFTTAPPQTTQPQNQTPVQNLTAVWDPGNNQVLLNWQSTSNTPVNFVVTRYTLGGPAAETGPGPGHGKGKKKHDHATVNTAAQQVVQLGEVNQTTFTDPTAQPGQSYRYIVQAVDPSANTPVGTPGVVEIAIPGDSGPLQGGDQNQGDGGQTPPGTGNQTGGTDNTTGNTPPTGGNTTGNTTDGNTAGNGLPIVGNLSGNSDQ